MASQLHAWTPHARDLVRTIVAGLLSLVFISLAHGGPRDDAGDPIDGPAYRITGFDIEYIQMHPSHPSLDDLMQMTVELGRIDSAYVAPRAGVETETRVIAELGGPDDGGGELFHASAVQTIILRAVAYFTEREYMGVYVAPHPLDITQTGLDQRPEGRTSLRLVVTTGVVSELRTVGSGDRVPQDARINHPLHQRIRDRSPIQPYEGGSNRPGDLLSRAVLDRYLFHLTRHPGRRVDAAVSAAGTTPGSVVLDYLITENDPLVMYFQTANTGTESTNEWQQRFGLMHTQLTNSDDILSLDFITSSFDETNAFIGSYERPFENDRIRWRVFGDWIEYTADDVGAFGDDFSGESWSVGGDLIFNVHQDRELFVDLVVGARVLEIDVDNPTTPDGRQTFFLPHARLRLDQTTEWFSTRGFVGVEWQAGNVTGIDDDELDRLGRTDPDDEWVVLNGGISYSVFLEPLLNRAAWEDPSTPKSSTLAHELALSVRGQYAFDNRLVPQLQHVAGGLYTVRGYRQSAVAGDSVIIGSVEYRYHVPRAFGVQREPREMFGEAFRLAPQHVYGVPDWDLILKGFLDVGRTVQSDRLSFESDETLIGAGVGVELIYRRNLNIRVDWGFALEDVDSAGIQAGSSQIHFVGTLLF